MRLIGIVGRVYKNIDNQNIIQINENVRKMVMKYDDVTCIAILPTESIDYLNCSQGTDGINKEKLDYILDKCDGFIIPGGTYYYNFDEYVINYAIENDKPLLGICLGFQHLCSKFAKNRVNFCMEKNVNLENHMGNPNEYKHNVIILENSLLYNIINKERIMVNSIHHDIVDFEMNTLAINAVSEDGVVEGVEYPQKRFILGVQWHPECLNDENSKKIIDRFMESLNA